MLSWIDLFAALRWWAVVTMVGLVAFPAGRWLFNRLPDHGYAVCKMLGVLLISYVFWLGASLGLLGNNLGGILVGVVAVGAFSIWADRRMGGGSLAWLRRNWRYLLICEGLFLLLFGLWALVRAQNPAITATEKPMDFAFLNASANSPTYPPLDPWLSGFAISYYYFGYVMVSVLGRLAIVPEAIAFNLGIAWLVAASGLGAFGLLINLVGMPAEDDRPFAPRNGLVLLAFMAAAAVPLAGNGQMLLETLHGNRVGTDSLWAWLDVRDLNGPPVSGPRYLDGSGGPSPGWWWWRASRPIHEYHLSGRPEEGLEPIAEFPAFSFILGDLHPHVMALPFALLSLVLAYQWFLATAAGPNSSQRPRSPSVIWGWLLHITSGSGLQRLTFTALVVGGLSFLNTWDVLIHLFILAGAIVLGRWRREGWSSGRLVEGATLGFLLGVMAYILYLPFYLGFSSQAGPPYLLPMLMRPTRLAQFLIIFGRSFLVIAPLLVVLLWRNRRADQGLRPGLVIGIGLPLGLLAVALLLTYALAAHTLGFGLIQGVVSDLGVALPPRLSGVTWDWSWATAAMGGLLPAFFAARISTLGLTILLAAVLGAVVYIWYGQLEPKTVPEADTGTGLPFVLLLIFTGALLTLGPEFLYLRDNFGQRLNTIFKFYYQAWILLSIGAVFGLGILWHIARPAGIAAGALYVPLLLFSLLYPLQAVRSRAVEYRGAPSAAERPPATLDGLEFLRRVDPADFEALLWLKANAPPGAVILEATGNPYSYYARVSANTGLPTVLGWANHEFQWRGTSTDEPGRRIPLVAEIFNTRDWEKAATLMDQYQIDYIFIGSLEQQEYDPRGLDKFEENLTSVFENGGVTIYRWTPTGRS